MSEEEQPRQPEPEPAQPEPAPPARLPEDVPFKRSG